MSSERLMYIIEIILLIVSLIFLLFINFFNKISIAIILLIFMIICNKYIRSDKSKGRYDRRITKLMIFVAIFYISAIYVLGIYIGFYNATVKFSKWSLINYIIPTIAIIITTEIIRKTVLLKEEKKSSILMLITCVILDVALTTNIFNVKSLIDYYNLIGFTLFSSIASNLLFNYIIIKFRNSNAIIGYRIITKIYLYLIPIVPNLHILLDSIIRIVIPSIIYVVLDNNYAKAKRELKSKNKIVELMISSILILISIGILMLVSCEFKYGALVIGSGSMTGTINKGDVIVFEAIEENFDSNIEIGDVIVFNKDGVRIIHRVIDKKDSGYGMRYYTKGDANPNEDEGFRIDSDIVGKVKMVLPYVGQVTIVLNEMFE